MDTLVGSSAPPPAGRKHRASASSPRAYRFDVSALPALPEGAIGFLTLRVIPGFGGRYALYHRSGDLSNTFAHDETPHDIAERNGLVLKLLREAAALHPVWLVFRKVEGR
jgi:hypothetical protein